MKHSGAILVDFERIAVGDRVEMSRTIVAEDVAKFCELTGDCNPLHMDDAFASQTVFQRRVVHGMLTASYVSTLVGTSLPGPGALWTQQSFRWIAPVFVGDSIRISLLVKYKSAATRAVTLEVQAMNQFDQAVLNGEGTVVLLQNQKRKTDVPIAERVALVTGGARGIGAAIVSALAQAGAAVVVQYRSSAARAEKLCDGIRDAGGRAIAFAAHVNEPEAIAAGLDNAERAFGKRVDLLVNNAGGPPLGRAFTECTWDEVQSLFDVHVQGAFCCSKAVLPGMLAQNSGRIVNIGSILTWSTPTVNDPGFVMAKAALKALTRSMATELGPRGIRVNMVSPGLTETESTSRTSERLRKVQALQTPLRRLCTPEDIAQTVLWLCSEGGAFVSGVDVPVCGGSVM
jgi:3-oxoacyl-[acyl-carrier protein] reductase